jgi:hypothetical protein
MEVRMPQVSLLPTVGEIAQRLRVPLHPVEYVILSRNLHPCGWAGNARIFSEADVAYIASELRRIDAQKGAAHE